ncbi:hypothetical protein Pfo_009077 [Paulownia fortunei]|nr:hypothetical protein Pfo_009077 [Paulownia fortunei]
MMDICKYIHRQVIFQCETNGKDKKLCRLTKSDQISRENSECSNNDHEHMIYMENTKKLAVYKHKETIKEMFLACISKKKDLRGKPMWKPRMIDIYFHQCNSWKSKTGVLHFQLSNP